MAEDEQAVAQSALADLQRRVGNIEARNESVEARKAWETSNTRRLCVLVLTYFVVCLVMLTLGARRPFAEAIVPTLGYFLSTLSIGVVRERWLRRRR